MKRCFFIVAMVLAVSSNGCATSSKPNVEKSTVIKTPKVKHSERRDFPKLWESLTVSDLTPDQIGQVIKLYVNAGGELIIMKQKSRTYIDIEALEQIETEQIAQIKGASWRKLAGILSTSQVKKLARKPVYDTSSSDITIGAHLVELLCVEGLSSAQCLEIAKTGVQFANIQRKAAIKLSSSKNQSRAGLEILAALSGSATPEASKGSISGAQLQKIVNRLSGILTPEQREKLFGHGETVGFEEILLHPGLSQLQYIQLAALKVLYDAYSTAGQSSVGNTGIATAILAAMTEPNAGKGLGKIDSAQTATEKRIEDTWAKLRSVLSELQISQFKRLLAAGTDL